MGNESKSKAELIHELADLRVRLDQALAFETELRQTERQSEERRLYLESLFACVPDAIVTSNDRGDVLEWNAGAERLFGYSAQEVRGRNIDDLIGGDVSYTRQALSGDSIPFTEVVRCRKDGTPVNVIMSCAPILVDGSLAGAVAVYTDVTEQKRLQAQLRQALRMEAIGRLAGGIAHDFNNLLTAIQGYTELALDSLSGEPEARSQPGRPVRADLEEIGRVSERAGVLVRQLLTFSRKQVLQPRVIGLNGVIRDVGKMLRPLIGEDIELSTILDAAPDQIEADPGQIEQMIVNLAINARDAMPSGGMLRIETANEVVDGRYVPGYLSPAPGPYLVMSVTDTGTGMSPDVVEHLFEPFFTTKDPERGTGLGLATVYGILRQLGGDVHVRSRLHRGTTFRLYLPQVHSAAPPSTEARARNARPRGVETILLVEDDETVRHLARRVLTRQGYTVIEASNPEEALAQGEATREQIRLLLTDVVMPGLSGQALAERLLAVRPGIPVVYMSGYMDEAIAALADATPGAFLLQKPFTPTTLAQKVREALDLYTEGS